MPDVPAGEPQREAWARALVAHLPGAAAFVVDPALRYLLAEGGALADAGLAPGDLVGRTVDEVLGAATAADQGRHFRRALAGESFAHEHTAYGHVYLTRGGPLRDAAGRVEAALAVSTDITEWRRAEEALRAGQARYRALATASADVIYRMSPDWSEMRQLDGRGFLSDTAEPSAAWLGRYIHPDDQGRVTAAIAEAVQARRPFALEHRVVRADGTLGWAASRAVPLLDARGEVTEWIGAASDVTARKAAEAALTASEAKYRTLFDSIDEGFCLMRVLYDREGRPWDMQYLEMNRAYERQSGVAGAAAGRTARELLPQMEDAWVAAYARVVETGESLRFEQHNRDVDRWFSVYLARVGDAGSDVVAAVVDDITARRRAEAALRASEARQAFLLALSDALRPLGDPVAIQAEATRVLGEHLGVSRALYCEIEPDGGQVVVARDYVHAAPSMVGRRRLGDFGATLQRELAAGRTVVDPDVLADPALSDAQRAAFGAVAVRAHVSVPLVKGGRLVGALAVHQAAPRAWTPAEVALVEEVAERTWAAVERARVEAALRVREEQYRAIVEGARDYAIVTTGLDGRVESWSPGAEAVFGWTAAEAVGMPMDVTFTPEDRAAGVPAREREAAAERGVAPDVRWHACKDGGRVFIEGTLRALRDDAGRLHGFLKVGQDVTRRRALDEALRASEARVRTLIENVRDYAIFLLDAEGRVTTWAAGAERLKGYTAEEAIGLHLSRFYAPEDVELGVPERHLVEAAAQGRGEWEGWRVRKDGSRFWANEIATAVRDGDGRLTGFTKISRDLTERRLAEQAAEQVQLAAARDDLRRALAAAEEAERRRLARELHDQLGQHLTAFRLGLDDAARLVGALAPAAPEGVRAGSDAPADPSPGETVPLLRRLAQLQVLAQRMTAGVRYVALELRPPELDDLGLESALATYVAEWGARYGVPAELELTGRLRERPLPTEVGSTLYRIVQEALTNVAKHAGATQVSVIVDKPDGEVRLIVEDDGRGFDVEATATRARAARRLGLAGMRERAALVGGTVSVESTPGAGTTLYARLPVGDAPLGDAPLGDAPASGGAEVA